jgi:DNA topoisomerase I
MPRLRRVDCSAPGIRRVRRGRGFSYHEEDGTHIEDREVVERVRGLAIPPAWEDVWICPHPRGHIQATGYDDAGRKQYLYHDAWREHRDRQKFEQMLDFGRALPAIRQHVARDLGARGLTRERVLACAIRLLDLGLFRIGSERYAAENETYGLSTLRRSHVKLERSEAVFDYRAKGSQRHVAVVADQLVLPTIRALKRRRGREAELFAYRNGRSWSSLRSEEINDHLEELAGERFTAKDFRTWNATVLAALTLAGYDPPPSSKAARRRSVNEAIETVAEYLSNTPAVCRSAYVDERVLDRFDSGETISDSLDRIADRSDPGEFADRERIEAAVILLIA